jgi:hypothetical protein
VRLLLIIALTACGNAKAPPPCAAVGAKFLVLAQRDLDSAKLDDNTRRLVVDQLPAMRDALVNACTDSAWEPSVRTCMVDATDHASFQQCEGALSTTQRDALERGVSDER